MFSTTLPLLSEATECEPEQTLACRVAFDVTGNEVVADLASTVISAVIGLAGIVLFAWLARWLAHRAIDRMVSRAATGVLPSGLGRLSKGDRTQGASEGSAVATSRRAQRTRTTGSLLKSIVSAVIGTIVIIMALAELGFNVAPLIASAGVVGVALGFGAQNLVRDFLSGIFMIFEDQLGVGDVVDVGTVSGTVEAVGLRITRLRDTDGTVWYVRNGEILRVGNKSQNWARAVIDVALPYATDVHRMIDVLRQAGHDLWDDDDFRGVLIEEPEVWGVQELTHDLLTVRMTVKTAPMEQWRVARVLRERIKVRLDAAGLSGTPLA
ncbi:mechanosensitive ion channel family protein [Nocardioides zeae]|uniref:Mechanosensitive ion channel family protein n=1 Tax=Nocardioides imazamoxiresistens TaxID=3231893 RepID=A0ABU3PRR8_9ACTN|nr:mechanosensitive ion channel family protein [Nocardioides zeae]MDT9591899.1 mechanosensitive ion channel family protein [Nocardioides zeae]